MPDKRRDSKGRLLKNGEIQRSDGRYEYKYIDKCGVRRSVYSWRLVETDKLPQGKRDKLPLRDLEKQIQKDLDDGINSGRPPTLDEYFNKYLDMRKDLKLTTIRNYRVSYNCVKPFIGHMQISRITHSIIRETFISLLCDNNLAYKTITTIKNALSPIFNSAIRDKIIRDNPLTGILKEINASSKQNLGKQRALTQEQQKRLIEYMKSDKHKRFWADHIIILLGTGCRIGEMVGLRWCDCDFQNDLISINHTCSYISDNGKMKTHITTPKTQASYRKIPMLKEVKEALLNIKKYCIKKGFNQDEIDGYSGFVFRNVKNSSIVAAGAISKVLCATVKAYNLQYPSDPLPHVHPHMLRHTFCTRLCEAGVNIKVIQEVMGHSNIAITMNVYTNITTDIVVKEFKNLEQIV